MTNHGFSSEQLCAARSVLNRVCGHCREHCSALTQLRASLVYEPALSSVQSEAAGLSAASEAADAQQRCWQLSTYKCSVKTAHT